MINKLIAYLTKRIFSNFLIYAEDMLAKRRVSINNNFRLAWHSHNGKLVFMGFNDKSEAKIIAELLEDNGRDVVLYNRTKKGMYIPYTKGGK